MSEYIGSGGNGGGIQGCMSTPEIANMESETDALEAALAYAARGWPVFRVHAIRGGGCTCGRDACDSPAKHPIEAHGHQDATTITDEILQRWEETPWANVGIRTGDGLGVLDIDSGHGGDETLADLEQAHGGLPDTPTVKTGGGGSHYFFALPAGIKIGNRVGLFDGVDFRGDGGYVVAPPSSHRSKNRYTWDPGLHFEDTPLADIPDWLLRALKARTNGKAALSAEEAIPEGERNKTLTSLAGTMRRRGMSSGSIAMALLAENETKCKPPLDEDEVRRIAESVSRYAPSGTGKAGSQMPVKTGGELPELRADEGDLKVATDEAIAVLVAANNPPWLFIHGGVPVRLNRDTAGRPVITTLTEDRLRCELSQVARYMKTNLNGGSSPAYPPLGVVRNILASSEIPFPELRGIVETPYFTQGGILCAQSGYDPLSRLYLDCTDSTALSLSDIPEKPSEPVIEIARNIIVRDLLGDFPFVSDADKAHAVALLFARIAREMISGPLPLTDIEKPSPGSGASLMVDVLSIVLTGRAARVMTEGRDEDEWRKRITATLRESPEIILIDNLRRGLDSAAVAAAITATVWTDRLLGKSENLVLPIRASFIVTGNNPALSTEIMRRTVRVRLDPRMDRPWLREEFRHPDLRGWATKLRGEILWAVCALVQAWVAHGMPKGKKKLGSFESWSETVGGILEVAGIPGFLQNLDDFYEEADTDGAAFRTLIGRWYELHGQEEIGVADLFPLAEEIDFPMGNGSERSQKTRLGKSLAEARDRRFLITGADGGPLDLLVVKGKSLKNAQKWLLQVQ